MERVSPGAQVDAKSAELIEEFKGHAAELRADPEFADADEGDIFEGWAIKKIAGLQVLVLQLAGRVEQLERR
jgi:hypothetical protein